MSSDKRSNETDSLIFLSILFGALGFLIYPFWFYGWFVFAFFDIGRRMSHHENFNKSPAALLFPMYFLVQGLIYGWFVEAGISLNHFNKIPIAGSEIIDFYTHFFQENTSFIVENGHLKFSKGTFSFYFVFMPVLGTLISAAGFRFHETCKRQFGFFYLLFSVPVNFPIFAIFMLSEGLGRLIGEKKDLNGKPLPRKQREGSVQTYQETKDLFVFGEGNGCLTRKNLSLGTQLTGGSGVGKSEFLKKLLDWYMRCGQGIIFFDYKADDDLKNWIIRATKNCGRGEDLRIIDFSNWEESNAYNPIRSGSPLEILDMFMGFLESSEQYYRNKAEDYLSRMTLIFDQLQRSPKLNFEVTLKEYRDFLTDNEFREFIYWQLKKENLDYWSTVTEISKELESDSAKREISGMISQLNKLIRSDIGKVTIQLPRSNESVSFSKAIENGEIIYVRVNSMALKESARLISQLALKDLMKTTSHYFGQNKGQKTALIIDEFASFANEDFISFIDKSRGAGIETTISHQSLSDLAEISENFKNRIYENTANKIIFTTQNASDAEYFASHLGTEEKYEYTDRVNQSLFNSRAETGEGSRRMVHEYVMHPNEFKRLTVGEVIVHCSKVDPHYGKTKVNLSPEFHEQSNEWEPNREELEGTNYKRFLIAFRDYKKMIEEKAKAKKAAQEQEVNYREDNYL